MIGKEKLLTKIREVLESKKQAIPLLGRHLSASLSFGGLDPALVRTAREKFDAWKVLQAKHVQALSELIEDLGKRGDDVF